MSRLSFLSAFGVAAILLACSSVDAGFRHRHADPSCGCEPSCGCVEPGCSAFEPVCCAEPTCGAAPCCPQPCITYSHKHAHRHRKCCTSCCEGNYETVLMATSPETCCTVAVPVCLPACCQGCPCESSRCTLLGCGQVRFDYCCGCSVIVRFQKCGNVHVIYEGF